MRVLSLYIHVPFCTRRCPYCSFYHVARSARNHDAESKYVDVLVDEIESACTALGEVRFATVFVGGGTPSSLGQELLARVFDSIAPYTDGGVTTEVTCELNPEDVTHELLAFLRDSGVNRVSVGVQSLDEEAQRRLKRCTPGVNLRAIERVRRAFANVSFDVLLGVPASTTAKTVETIQRLGQFDPEHFSVYCLEPGGDMAQEVSAFFASVDGERAADEYLAVCSILRERGYRHYEVSNFAYPGFESAHNRVYWGGGEYLGVGPAAHSCIGGRRFHNAPSLDEYLHSGAGNRVEEVGEPDVALERAMLALRTDDGMLLSWVTCGNETIEELTTSGLAERRENHLVLTDRGYLLMNDIVLRICPAPASGI